MKKGDLVRFSIGTRPPGSRVWKVGLLLSYHTWEKIAKVLYEDKVWSVRAEDCEKAGKKDIER